MIYTLHSDISCCSIFTGLSNIFLHNSTAFSHEWFCINSSILVMSSSSLYIAGGTWHFVKNSLYIFSTAYLCNNYGLNHTDSFFGVCGGVLTFGSFFFFIVFSKSSEFILSRLDFLCFGYIEVYFMFKKYRRWFFFTFTVRRDMLLMMFMFFLFFFL